MSGVVEEPTAVRFEAANGITLCIATRGPDGVRYPSSRIRKGLTMSCGAIDLSEEGVGFGVPVLKQPRETIFPGILRVTAGSETSVLVAEYDMNLVERLTLRKRPSLAGIALNAVREPLATLHRRFPALRRVLTGISNAMRAALGIRTTFEQTESRGVIRMTYRFDAAAGKVQVLMEAHDLAVEGCTELAIMNEQGAHFFDCYTDSTGCALNGASIETWQGVSAGEATFLDTRHRVFFSMKNAPGARLFRGRELIEGRLAWAGFAYVLPSDTKEFSYSIAIGTLG
jgi:hypothetical protein